MDANELRQQEPTSFAAKFVALHLFSYRCSEDILHGKFIMIQLATFMLLIINSSAQFYNVFFLISKILTLMNFLNQEEEICDKERDLSMYQVDKK